MQYRFAEFVLDADTETVSGPDGPLPLRQRAFQLLRALLEHAPSLVSRDTILDEVWGHDALSANVLPQTISEIRQILGDSAQSPRLIETRHRRGYRMMVAVERLEAAAPAMRTLNSAADESISDTSSPDLVEPTNPRQQVPSTIAQRWRWLWIPAACLLLIACVVAWRGFQSKPASTTEAVRPALAILPGTNAGGPQWLPDAGTELLTVALSGDDRLQLLRSDGRGDEHADNTTNGGDNRWQLWMREVLGADYALTGTWQADSGGIAFHYSLLRLSDGHIAHAGSLHNADLATLCRDVARDLRRNLRLIDPGSSWLAELPREPEAREAYYRGLAALAQGEPGTAVTALKLATADPQAGNRVHIALATAYRRSGRMVQAREQFKLALASGKEHLSVGERLRLEAESALVNDRPADAAASLRALHRLAPQDVEVAIALTDAQIRARQADAATATLTSISTLASGPNEDPRWHLAQARLAALKNDNPARRAAAERALQLARKFGRTSLAVEADVELAQAERADGDLPAARKRLEAILATNPPRALLPEVQTQLGSLLRDTGEFGNAKQHLEVARKLYADNGNRSGELRVQIELHIIDSERGQSEQAYKDLIALEPQVRELDDPVVLARYYNTLGVQAIRNDRVDDANTYLQRAATEARRANQPTQEAGAYTNLGQVLARNKRFDEAREMWDKALKVFRDSGDRLGEAITLSNLGAVASVQGNGKRSRDLNRQAVELLRQIGASQHLARTAFNLGLAIERDGDLHEAEKLFTESLAAYRAGKGGDPVPHVIAALARVQLALGNANAVRKLLESAEADVATLDNPLAKSLLEAARGHMESANGRIEASRQHHQQARKLRIAAHREDWQAMSDLDLLMLDLQAGKPAEPARAGAERIAERLASAGDRSGELQAIIVEATALIRLDRRTQALAVIAQGRKLIADNANAGMSQQLDRLRILATDDPPATRQARLQALAADAVRGGFQTFAWRCQLDALAAVDRQLPELEKPLRGNIEEHGLAGLLMPLP